MSMMTQHSYKTKASYYDELKEHVTFWMNSLTVTSFVLFLILLVWLLPGPYTPICCSPLRSQPLWATPTSWHAVASCSIWNENCDTLAPIRNNTKGP